MDSEIKFQPGLFHLFDLRDKKAVAAMIEQAQEYLKEYSGQLDTSWQNVLGVLQIAFGTREDKEKAIEIFKQVLLEDPENLNALENSRFVHDQLGQKEEAEECGRKFNSLLGNDDSSQNLAARKARCFAGQGIAIKCHIDAGQQGLKILDGEDLTNAKTAVKYFELAMKVDDEENNQAFEPEERLQWQFFLGRSYYEVFERCLRKGYETEDELDLFNKAVRALTGVARESTQNHFCAKSWTLLGTIFWKMSIFIGAYKPRSILYCGLKREYNDPEICFQNASRLSPKDPKILARYSRFLLKEKRYKEAVEITNESIKIDDSKKNWFAISSRAEAYKKMYIEQNNESAETQGDTDLLMRAKEDFEKVVKITQKLQERIELGKVLKMLKQTDEAIQQFQYVIDNLEGENNFHLHKQMGFCLQEKSPRAAIESFKRAVEIERGDVFKSVCAFNTLKLLLIMYGQQPSTVYLLDEICYWLTLVREKYKNQTWLKLIQGLCRQFGGHMVRVCKRLVDQKKYNLASKCLSELIEIDKTEIEEIDRLNNEIEKCSAEMSASSLSGAEQHTKTAYIRPALKSSKNRKNTFDCLVLHCIEKADADWVRYSLLPRLEEAHGYKCCVPARDIHSHSPRDFESCVVDAGCVIVVLTPSFCSDAHCQDQLAQIVSDGSNEVIPVMREDCDLPEVLSGMKVIQYYSWELLLRQI